MIYIAVMMDFKDWKKYKLGDICIKIGSGATPKGGKEVYLDSGAYAFIRSQNVLDFSFSYDGLAYLNEAQAQKLNNVALIENDVLLNITGDSVARVCQVPKAILPARVNQHVSIIRPNKKMVNAAFLKYFLLNPKFKAFMLVLSSVGGTRNALTKLMIQDFEITLPDLATQNSIAAILTSLDDKIELNRQNNATLEAMAQTLFQEMCLPKKEDEDWRIVKLKDLVTIKYGKDHKHLENGNIPVYGSGGIMRYANKAIYEKESILIPRKGTLNNLFYLNKPFWSVDTMFYTQLNSPLYGKYLFFLLKSFNLASMNVGSAVPSLTTEVLNNLNIQLPPKQNLNRFCDATNSIFAKIDANNAENQTLITLRDNLLPKLMRGELLV
jgi:type I restriction enzyme, S subunit